MALDSGARTDVSTVQTMFKTDLDGAAIEFWINVAYPVVDDVEAAGTSLSDPQLARLEAVYAAGLMETQDPRIQSGTRESGQVDFGDRQSYMALAEQLDDTGTIQNQNAPTVSFDVYPDDESFDDPYGYYDPY